MDLTLNNPVLRVVFDGVTLAELLVLLTLYFEPRGFLRKLPQLAGTFLLCAPVWMIVNFHERYDINVMITGAFLICCAYALMFLAGNPSYKAALCLYFVTLYMQLHSAELGVLLFVGAKVSRVFAAQIALAVIILLNRRFGAQYSEEMPRVFILAITLSTALCLSLCMVMLPHLMTADTGMGVVVSLATLGLNLLAFYMGQELMRAYQQQMRMREIAERIQRDSSMARETGSILDELRVQRHEHRNQALVLRMLCEAEDWDALKRFVAEHYGEEEDDAAIDCGNRIVNAVLRQKSAAAKRKGVALKMEVYVPPRLPIDDSDLCSLLANLLDNAIDGCAGEKRVVRIQIRCVKNYLQILIVNPVAYDVLERNPDLNTTKEHGELHGVGVRLIRSIVERYDGMLDFSVHDGLFTADALLKLVGA